MNGNVIEWCQDYGYYYTEDAQINPVCTSSDYEHERMYRGGCYSDQANWFSVVYRNWMVPTRVDDRYGLRLALEPRVIAQMHYQLHAASRHRRRSVLLSCSRRVGELGEIDKKHYFAHGRSIILVFSVNLHRH